MKKHLGKVLIGILLIIGITSSIWIQVKKEKNDSPVVSEVLYRKAGENDYQRGGAILNQGEVGEITIALRAKNTVRDILWSLKKFLPSTLSYLEGTMKINGKPVKETELTLALSQEEPTQVSFQVVATEKTIIPNTTPLIARETQEVKTGEQKGSTPVVTTCPEQNIALVKDTPLALLGTHLSEVAQIELGNLTFPPNKKTDTVLLLNVEATRLTENTYPITLIQKDGKKQKTNCTLTITKPSTPVFDAITPKESKAGKAQKLVVQGGNLSQITKVSAQKNGKTFPIQIQAKQTSVMILEIGADYEPGNYTLTIEAPRALSTPLHFTLLP